MDRKFIYVIVILLSITLVVADYYMNRSLESVEYLKLVDDDVANGLSVDDELELTSNENVPLVSFTLTNKQSDNKNLEYTYEIKIDNLMGTQKYTKADGKTYYQVFTANGETTLTLNSNESITFTEIPINSNYTITQTTVDKYKTYIGEDEKNTISGVVTKDSTLTFNNVLSTSSTPLTPTPTEPSTPITPEKPTTPEEPTKPNEPTEDKKNPTTSDSIKGAFVLLIVLSILLIISLTIKVKRFD